MNLLNIPDKDFQFLAELNANECTTAEKRKVLRIIKDHNMPYNVMEKELQISRKGLLSSWNQVHCIVPVRRRQTKKRHTQSANVLKSIGSMTVQELEGVIRRQQDELSKVDLIKQIEINAKLLIEKRA